MFYFLLTNVKIKMVTGISRGAVHTTHNIHTIWQFITYCTVSVISATLYCYSGGRSTTSWRSNRKYAGRPAQGGGNKNWNKLVWRTWRWKSFVGRGGKHGRGSNSDMVWEMQSRLNRVVLEYGAFFCGDGVWLLGFIPRNSLNRWH